MMLLLISKYVPDGVYAMNAAPRKRISGSDNHRYFTIYVYKYHYAGREKMQSAWFKYTLMA